jgi:hypothetical protein
MVMYRPVPMGEPGAQASRLPLVDRGRHALVLRQLRASTILSVALPEQTACARLVTCR